jgi:hypothetical protein
MTGLSAPKKFFFHMAKKFFSFVYQSVNKNSGHFGRFGGLLG